MASIAGRHLPNKGVDNVDWITPPEIIQALGGHESFDLDPCAAPRMPWPTAKTMVTKEQNGITLDWSTYGRCWLNPPYGLATAAWLYRMANHNNGVALIFARVETRMWFTHIWKKASAILFLDERLFFHDQDGIRAEHNAGGPSALVAYDKPYISDSNRPNFQSLQYSGLGGALIDLCVGVRVQESKHAQRS